MKTKFNINEEYFTKIKNTREFSEERLFRIDQDTGEIHQTTEINHNNYSFYLTYEEYLKVVKIQKPIVEQIELMKEKQKTLLQLSRITTLKILSERDKNDKKKKFNL